MKNRLLVTRLLELGGSLEGIMQELSEAFDNPAPNPRKRKNLKEQRMARIINIMDGKKNMKKRIS